MEHLNDAIFQEKADSKRDWNCPWVRGDGKGLKRLLRPSFTSDPVVAPVHTSLAHFYRFVCDWDFQLLRLFIYSGELHYFSLVN